LGSSTDSERVDRVRRAISADAADDVTEQHTDKCPRQDVRPVTAACCEAKDGEHRHEEAKAQKQFKKLPHHIRGLIDVLLAAADRETLLMLNPLLARLVQGSERSR